MNDISTNASYQKFRFRDFWAPSYYTVTVVVLPVHPHCLADVASFYGERSDKCTAIEGLSVMHFSSWSVFYYQMGKESVGSVRLYVSVVRLNPGIVSVYRLDPFICYFVACSSNVRRYSLAICYLKLHSVLHTGHYAILLRKLDRNSREHRLLYV